MQDPSSEVANGSKLSAVESVQPKTHASHEPYVSKVEKPAVTLICLFAYEL